MYSVNKQKNSEAFAIDFLENKKYVFSVHVMEVGLDKQLYGPYHDSRPV